MKSSAHPTAHLRIALRKIQPLLLGLLLTGGAISASADEALAKARVERWIAQPMAGKDLPERMACKADMATHTGPWLLVSRAWGGSPHLRHYQLVRWEVVAPPSGSHVAVRWGHCPEHDSQGR
jgi:hypothetical protein